MKRRHFLAGATAALATPAIAAGIESQTLRYVPQADLALLDPIITPTLVTRDHAYLVFDTLYGVDAALVARPQMVEGHVVEDDGLTWRMTLRDGLRFHDGAPVLARDVVASLQRWAQKDTYGFDLLPILNELSAPSDKEVRFRLKQPFPTLPDALGKASSNMPAIMPERLAKSDASKAVVEMIGSGPFRYVAAERVAGARNVYERFDGYVPRPSGQTSFLAGPKIAHLARVEWRTIPDPATAAAALQSGEVDWWSQPIPDLVPSLRKSGTIQTEVLDPSGYLAFLRLNHLQPPFDNPALRRALFPALNQAEILTAAVGEDPQMYHAGIGYVTPGPLANDAGMGALTSPRSLERARAAVQASGYKGERVVFMAPADYASIYGMSLVTADLLRQIGVTIDLQTVDWGTQVQRWNSKQPIGSGGWSAYVSTSSAITAVSPADNKSIRGIGARGSSGWPTSPRIEALRSEFLSTSDPARQKQICRDIQEQAFQDVPYVPLGVFYQLTAWRQGITGVLRGLPLFYNVRKA